MTSYPRVIERPYKVYTGEAEYTPAGWNEEDILTGVNYFYQKSFRLGSDADAYAERMSENYEFVKIEKKENN